MYNSHNFTKIDNETFNLHIDTDKDYKILQLTDLHLGFGILSGKKDKLALSAVTKIIKKSRPDLIVLTGDSIFPFFPKSGTMNNGRQARILTAFMDRFKIPYTLCFGNHDCELGAFCNKDELADIFAEGKYCIFTKGNRYIYGVGNFFINLVDDNNKAVLPLVMLDSNMYGDGGWFYSGFDCMHKDQTEWCMNKLTSLKNEDENIKAMAFFHMPVREFKEAYERMKLGDNDVIYKHGSVGEKNDHFGIIFLDVEMPEINGVDIARQIRKITQDVIICFVTSFDKYAIQAYGVEALAYVVKPVAYAELKRVLSRAVVLVQYTFDYKEAEERYIEVPVSRNTRIVDVRTIQYIEKRRNQCVLHCTDAEITCYETLKKICSKLDQNIFIYVHQGYIVNFDAIKEVKENVVCLGDGVEVPLSRSHYKEVKNRHMSKIRKLLEERKM